MERPDLVFRSYVASGLTTAIVGVPLVRSFGLRGAVYGMLISAGMYTTGMLVGLLQSVRSSANRISLSSAV
jgi:hypothetical protein